MLTLINIDDVEMPITWSIIPARTCFDVYPLPSLLFIKKISCQWEKTKSSLSPHISAYWVLLHFVMSAAVECGSGGGDDSSFGLRIASVFIILVGSTSGALFPVLAKRSSWLHVPKPVFEFVFKSFFHNHGSLWSYSFAKFFGSGVIVRSASL